MSGIDDADELEAMIKSANTWPVWSAGDIGGVDLGVYPQIGMYGRSLRDIELWVAMRESDRQQIKSLIQWDPKRDYKVDNLPERISQAYSDLLFGEDPNFTAFNEADQDNLTGMIEENDLPSELRRWANDCSSEGEVWWRVYVNREISEWPIAEAHSRLDVIPLFRGRRIVAAAFVDTLYSQKLLLEGQIVQERWRHIEIQATGVTRNLLFHGGIGNIGKQVSLSEQPDTEGLPDEWQHNLDIMLCGRIPNKLGRDWRVGISDYQGIRDLLLDLNEARVIMAENARVAGKKRVIGPAALLQRDGTFPAGVDYIVRENLEENMDPDKQLVVLDFQFNAAPLLEHINDLTVTALTRVGLAEQFVASRGSGEGQATSATALRTRLIPTTLAASGKARFWDDGTPKLLRAMSLVSAIPIENGGTGQSWTAPNELPSMQRSSVLPEDPAEEVTRHVMAVAGEVESVYQALEELHPDWSEDQVAEEMQRIKDDRAEFGTGPKEAVPPPAGGP